jgi:hypothetical protein
MDYGWFAFITFIAIMALLTLIARQRNFGSKSTLPGSPDPKCPHQLCRHYQSKCGICCRQIRFDMFEAIPSKQEGNQ